MKREHLTGFIFCLTDSLNHLRTAGWKSNLDREYSYAHGLIGGAMLVGAISLDERDRLMELMKNAREYAMKEMQ